MVPHGCNQFLSTCPVLLPLQRDFVVIALLRVNNDIIKEICARAFFNLLKPEATRAAMVDSAQVLVGWCLHYSGLWIFRCVVTQLTCFAI